MNAEWSLYSGIDGSCLSSPKDITGATDDYAMWISEHPDQLSDVFVGNINTGRRAIPVLNSTAASFLATATGYATRATTAKSEDERLILMSIARNLAIAAIDRLDKLATTSDYLQQPHNAPRHAFTPDPYIRTPELPATPRRL